MVECFSFSRFLFLIRCKVRIFISIKLLICFLSCWMHLFLRNISWKSWLIIRIKNFYWEFLSKFAPIFSTCWNSKVISEKFSFDCSPIALFFVVFIYCSSLRQIVMKMFEVVYVYISLLINAGLTSFYYFLFVTNCF